MGTLAAKRSQRKKILQRSNKSIKLHAIFCYQVNSILINTKEHKFITAINVVLILNFGRTLDNKETKATEAVVSSISSVCHSYTIMLTISAAGNLMNPRYRKAVESLVQEFWNYCLQLTTCTFQLQAAERWENSIC